MYSFHFLDYFILALYLIGMVAIGVWFSKRHKDFDDFFLAGRTLTTPILISTLISTYYGIDVLFGDSQLAFTDGVVAWFGYARPTYAFFFIAAFMLAHRLRAEDFRSLPDILDRYYGKKTRYVAALASFFYSLPTLSLYGFGVLGEAVFGWQHSIGMLVMGGVTLIYTLTGGFWAVVITDSIQFLMMCLVLAIATPFVFKMVGGFDQLIATLDPSFFKPMGELSIWLVIIYASTGLTILVEPTFYQRIFAAKSYKNVRNALLIGIFLWGSYDWLVTILAMAAKTGVIQGIISPDIAPDTSLLVIMGVSLPVGLLGLFMAGVLATEMSTLDSYCLIAGGNLAYDIYKPALKPDASDKELIEKTRWGVGLSWILGFIIANFFGQMLGLWVFMASILISSVLIPIMFGLFIPKVRKTMAGLISTAAGLFSTIALNSWIMIAGTYIPEEETYVLHIGSWAILQEYVMYYTVPISLLGFIAGLMIEKGRRS